MPGDWAAKRKYLYLLLAALTPRPGLSCLCVVVGVVEEVLLFHTFSAPARGRRRNIEPSTQASRCLTSIPQHQLAPIRRQLMPRPTWAIVNAFMIVSNRLPIKLTASLWITWS